MMFRVLGPLEVETDDGPIPLPGQRPRALLTALLLEPNSVVPVHGLVEALWGEELPDAPANALQQVVARLRTRLGPVGTAIVTRPPGYVLVVDPASVDAQCFESDYRAARSIWSTDPLRAGTLLDDALRWWRGPAYAEFADGFAGPAAARLDELRISALEDRAALFVQSGAATDAIATAREVMTRAPLRERPVELLMRALHIDARAGEALEVFREYRELLADELGLDPSPQLRDLETQILQDGPGTAQVLRPPIVLIAPAGGGTSSNLPAQLTSFVGRESAVAEVTALLATTRLLTVTGPGGTGKTRLALEVAAALSGEYADGTFFVDLVPVRDPALVVPTIAATLGIREEGWERPVRQALEEDLRRRRLLLLLDNFEQVLDAAPVVTQLLAAAAGLTVLVTSRAPLRVRGEQVVPLGPLEIAYPGLRSLDSLARVEGVALFTQRAAAAGPRFTLTEQNAPAVAELVSRLDGLPLAIELAASRTAVLGPEAMLQRLDRHQPLLEVGARDLPARQQTLRAAIGWSYDLLAAGERSLFRRVSVLTGGFTPQAAATVCAGEDAGRDVLTGLTALADISLVFPVPVGDGDVRFGMLQTIREFALDRLTVEDDRAGAERRHAQWFMRVAEDAEPGMRGPQLLQSIVTLQTEHENLRAALRWSIEHDDADVGLRIVGALWRFWHLAGHLSEGRHWTAAVLDLPSAAGRTVARAKALSAAGGLAYWQGDVPAVQAAYEEAVAISEELGDEASLAKATYDLAFAYGLVPTRAHSRRLFEASREMFERVGNAVGVADTLWALAMMTGLAGDYATARNLADDSVRRHRELGDAFGLVDALSELGRATRELGEFDTARSCFLEALQGLAAIGYRTAVAITLDNLAALENRLGHHIRALRLAGAAEALTESAGGRVPPEFADLPDLRQAARAAHPEERIAQAWTQGRAMSLAAAVDYARTNGLLVTALMGGARTG
jgi:predicted ATPase/DNA-binding SARP family transcriptional activator